MQLRTCPSWNDKVPYLVQTVELTEKLDRLYAEAHQGFPPRIVPRAHAANIIEPALMSCHPELDDFTVAVLHEVAVSDAKHGPFASIHQAKGVMDEEIHELEQEIFKKSEERNHEHMLNEAVQVAACCHRLATLIRSKMNKETKQ